LLAELKRPTSCAAHPRKKKGKKERKRGGGGKRDIQVDRESLRPLVNTPYALTQRKKKKEKKKKKRRRGGYGRKSLFVG